MKEKRQISQGLCQNKGREEKLGKKCELLQRQENNTSDGSLIERIEEVEKDMVEMMQKGCGHL